MARSRELLEALRRFGLENDRLDAVVARRLGAAEAEFKAMDHLHAAGELTPGQLADRLALTSGAITALVDRLERSGWVTREPHPRDRRSIVVRPAELGGEAAQIYAGFLGRMTRAAERLSPAQRAAFLGFLEEATRAAAAHADEVRRGESW